jgi:hypothetical protein
MRAERNLTCTCYKAVRTSMFYPNKSEDEKMYSVLTDLQAINFSVIFLNNRNCSKAAN